jgi:hypothetical protein
MNESENRLLPFESEQFRIRLDFIDKLMDFPRFDGHAEEL